ncbi:MAG TPA: type 1 glutamine amidotransferase [Pseudonocardiaceae bacterium]|nr:type 1 glutamine amidotransferase [Pseudonocardiaceae bacterium]
MTALPEPGRWPLLVVRHVRWEGPQRILDSFPDTPVDILDLLDDDTATLPRPDAVRGAVFMGGPMSANDAESLPRLRLELDWLTEALALGVPLLGICLGSQLIAKAAGSTISRAPETELGVAEVQILAEDDPLAGALAPSTPALHWHGERLSLPDGAVHLARSAKTEVQAFRLAANAWGLLFHPEADEELLANWLAEPTMAEEARTVLGPDYARQLSGGVALVDRVRSRRAFDAFAEHCARQAKRLS